MRSSQVQLAARNNALWCDAVCRAHGAPGEFFPAVWLNRNAAPPYYSNLVTVSESGAQSATLEHIRSLMGLPLPACWSVKDSFFHLELRALGFEPLFEASWIWREPEVGDGGSAFSGVSWSRVASSAGLTMWEAAWAGNERNAEAGSASAQFPSSLLADPQILFFTGSSGQEIVAGGIASRSGGVVGLSNVFVNSGDPIVAWTGLVRITGLAFPGLPLVGYERGASLDAAVASGFETIGPLRVWTRTG